MGATHEGRLPSNSKVRLSPLRLLALIDDLSKIYLSTVYSVAMHRSILANYVAKSGVLYWYSKKEGHGCCNGPNVKVECAIHI